MVEADSVKTKRQEALWMSLNPVRLWRVFVASVLAVERGYVLTARR